MIGFAAALLLYLNGRIAGISGIAGSVIYPRKGDLAWRVLFVAGLVLGGFAYQWLGIGRGVAHIESVVDTPALIAAGLLVGIGTSVGSGCTSGHGICGLARGSARSLVATLSFMLSGFATVYIVRHVVGGGL